MSPQTFIMGLIREGKACPSCGAALSPSPPPPDRVEESTVRGYRVRTFYRTPKDWKERREAVVRVITRAAVRRARERQKEGSS